MIEHEIAFVFTPAAFNAFCKVAALNIDHDKEAKIVDCYLDTGLRVRQEERTRGSADYNLVEKTGKKSEGSRVELSSPISREAAEILSHQTKLMVIKDRCRLYGKLVDGYIATVDYVSSPMALVIMEVESEYGPIHQNLVSTLLDKYHLQICPLSAWQLFKRKIGICGAPSSGKSETAKYISNTLNTKYNSNSFNVVEYATSFIQKYGRTPGFDDAFLVWYGQHEREKDARTSDVVISDCPTFLAYIYMKFHRPPKFDAASALSMAKMYKRALLDVQTYSDLVFLEMAEYRDNGVRYHNRNEAERIQSMIHAFLSEHNIPFIMSDCRKSDELLRKLFYINNQATY